MSEQEAPEVKVEAPSPLMVEGAYMHALLLHHAEHPDATEQECALAAANAVAALVQAETIRYITDALYLEPCHTTGAHNPNHTTTSVCDLQRSRLATKVLSTLGIVTEQLPRRLHAPDSRCRCHDVPGYERHRETLRALHDWAGVPISDELAAPGTDVPREGDDEIVLSALTREYESWQVVLKRITDTHPELRFTNLRYFNVLNPLSDRGLVEQAGIGARLAPPA